MDVYWVDTADYLKRDYLQGFEKGLFFGKRVMLTTVCAKTFFLNRCKLQGRGV